MAWIKHIEQQRLQAETLRQLQVWGHEQCRWAPAQIPPKNISPAITITGNF